MAESGLLSAAQLAAKWRKSSGVAKRMMLFLRLSHLVLGRKSLLVYLPEDCFWNSRCLNRRMIPLWSAWSGRFHALIKYMDTESWLLLSTQCQGVPTHFFFFFFLFPQGIIMPILAIFLVWTTYINPNSISQWRIFEGQGEEREIDDRSTSLKASCKRIHLLSVAVCFTYVILYRFPFL